jgi:hypothetical protein
MMVALPTTVEQTQILMFPARPVAGKNNAETMGAVVHVEHAVPTKAAFLATVNFPAFQTALKDKNVVTTDVVALAASVPEHSLFVWKVLA